MSILDVKATETDQSMALQDTKTPTGEQDVNIAAQISGLILDRYNFAKTSRLPDEERWMRFWRNFRGIYGPQVKFTDTEKSTVFVKITKTKVIAAISKIMEILHSNGDFPISIEPTKKPLGIAESIAVSETDDGSEDDENTESPYGYEGDGKDWAAGSTHASLAGPALAKQIDKAGLKVHNNPNDVTLDQATVTLDPAEICAKQMEKTIQDQIDEADGMRAVLAALYEMAVLGTGALKGAISKTKTYNQWTPGEDGALTYDPIKKDVPILEAPSIWYLYPDPEATNVTDLSWMIQRHGLNSSKLRGLGDRPGFRSQVIEYLLDNYTPNYQPLWFEHELKDFILRPTTNRYEVLEFWGIVDKQLAEKFDITIPKEFKDDKEVYINAWICCNQVIRFVINPFLPVRIPYMLCPYEVNPYKIWGIGVAENMEDSQLIMNGHARMAIDNLALAGNVVFEVDETYMTNTEDMRIYPGRVFRRQGGPPGQAIYAIKFPSTTQDNMLMFDKFRALADEATNIPSIAHGQTGVTGTTRTSSGMSMIMNASTDAIKSVIRNIDEYFIRPIGESFFAWNMQFNPDVEIRGDLEVRARGTSSLMQKEVRTQRLMMFMQVGSNPMLAPFIKWYAVLKEIVRDLDIGDPEKFVNDIEAAKLQALIIRTHNSLAEARPEDAQDVSGQDMMPGGMGGTNPGDTQGSGGSTIGTGTPTQSGEPGFTGNE